MQQYQYPTFRSHYITFPTQKSVNQMNQSQQKLNQSKNQQNFTNSQYQSIILNQSRRNQKINTDISLTDLQPQSSVIQQDYSENINTMDLSIFKMKRNDKFDDNYKTFVTLTHHKFNKIQLNFKQIEEIQEKLQRNKKFVYMKDYIQYIKIDVCPVVIKKDEENQELEQQRQLQRYKKVQFQQSLFNQKQYQSLSQSNKQNRDQFQLHSTIKRRVFSHQQKFNFLQQKFGQFEHYQRIEKVQKVQNSQIIYKLQLIYNFLNIEIPIVKNYNYIQINQLNLDKIQQKLYNTKRQLTNYFVSQNSENLISSDSDDIIINEETGNQNIVHIYNRRNYLNQKTPIKHESSQPKATIVEVVEEETKQNDYSDILTQKEENDDRNAKKQQLKFKTLCWRFSKLQNIEFDKIIKINDTKLREVIERL